MFADGMVTGRMEDNSERSEANHRGTKGNGRGKGKRGAWHVSGLVTSGFKKPPCDHLPTQMLTKALFLAKS